MARVYSQTPCSVLPSRTRRSPSGCCSPAIPAARCGSRSSCSTRPRCSTTTAGCGATPATAADGAPLTIQSTGLGGPSTAIVVEELIALGARRLVRVGTCGALVDAELGSLVIAEIGACPRRREPRARRRRRARRRPRAARRAARGGQRRGDRRRRVRPTSTGRPRPGRRRARPLDGGACSPSPRATALAAACVLARDGRERIDPEALEHAEAELGRVGAAALWTRASSWPACSSACAFGWAPRRRLVDLQALLLARRRRRARRRASMARWEISQTSLASWPSTAGEPVVEPPARWAMLGQPLVEPVDRLLDALHPLGHRAQPARQPLDVGRRRDVERAHRGLLRLHGALARLERPRDRGVHERVLEQLLGELAERVLALAGDPVAQPALGVVCHGVLLAGFRGSRCEGRGDATRRSRRARPGTESRI